ncbi:alpha/beta hydrolase-fold protein [Tuwongella immobilis]|uniref:Uncharacterized protein n=1 Tax=Tuwongella immobilis TaxID=692036 RepID=A0A6C2YQI7_9BACT|nr:alpha/beta hydrolase-fold protein [Tuwongella immobilis]VIP03152.1 Uncharacterized protein OS=Pirellula staleyi (strain ATCC 27377 / DSM 6068 / ICPB 4128) GN=Psta_1643 PE=4 SV=1: Esterase [Tuwongella immobilis]VTS03543.1 Uncharacterized protein OS=Pirellula staleyi (strain ATCC 27377 / DSM 6068 / ICPB 4128) GN=Psta_1643 PE=4 SV=1: Esterase [Tuwongella immobilis]
MSLDSIRWEFAGQTVVTSPRAGSSRYGLIWLADLVEEPPQSESWWSGFAAQGFHVATIFGDGRFWTARQFSPSAPETSSPPSEEAILCDDVIPRILAEWGTSPRMVALAGNGIGGGAALRIAFRYPERFRVVAAWEPILEWERVFGLGTQLDLLYPNPEICRQDTASMHIHPSQPPSGIWFASCPANQPWHRGADRLAEKLAAFGVDHTFRELAAPTSLQCAANRALLIEMQQWLAAQMLRSSRSLLD